MAIKVVFSIFGVFLFLFLFWRRLKEDYASSQIFTTAFYILLGIFLASGVSIYFFPSWWFWLELVAALVGIVVAVWRFRLRFFEVLEAFILAILPWFGFVFVWDFIRAGSQISALASGVIVLLIGLFYFLDSHYRGFTWYQSGRVGFSGMTVAGIFFLIRVAVAVGSFGVLSLVNGKDSILSGITAFLCFLAVYSLAKEVT